MAGKVNQTSGVGLVNRKTKKRKNLKTADLKYPYIFVLSFSVFRFFGFSVKLVPVCGLFFACSCAQPLHKSKYVVAGTFLEVKSYDSRAGKIVYDEIKRLENIFSFYKESSELSRLNRSFDTSVKVSDELFDILKLSYQVYAMSGGAFDPASGNLFKLWKGLIAKGGTGRLPSADEIAEIKKNCGFNFVELYEKDKTVTLRRRGLSIDLAAIADGYMVDQAALKLKKAGISGAIVDLGGDIYCLGRNSNRPWRVGIKDAPEVSDIIATQNIEDEGAATSGNYEQFFELNGKQYSHLIDPKTGYPVDDKMISVTVIAKNCTTADSLSTAFFVMGVDRIRKFISLNPSTMRIFVVMRDENGKKRVHIIQ